MALLLAWSLTSASVGAQDVPIPAQLGGRDGLWFSLEEGRAAVGALREATDLRERLHLAEERLELALDSVDSFRDVANLADADATAALELVSEARADLATMAAHQARTSWERDLLGGLAAGFGVVAIILGVILGAILGG